MKYPDMKVGPGALYKAPGGLMGMVVAKFLYQILVIEPELCEKDPDYRIAYEIRRER